MNTINKNQITLVGAGLVGSLLSIFLSRRGYSVEVLERREDMRVTGIDEGRSINLAISTRGLTALREVGLEEEALKIALPMCGRLIHAINGEMSFHRYGVQDRECIYSISRGDLNRLLMNHAEKDHGVKIDFGKKVTGVNLQEKKLKVENSADIPYHIAIGTDGSASALRHELCKQGQTVENESFLPYGYKELTIPRGPHGEHQIAKNVLHIWPRSDFMLIALPNLDGSFTATLFFPFKGPLSFESVRTREDVQALFAEHFRDVRELMPELSDEFFANPTGKMVTIKCEPWNYLDQVLLMGDAAHAIVPFFGQGMNCGFEDCSIFDRLLGQKGMDWGRTMDTFSKLRKPNADAIADMAAENFIEMRDKVAKPDFVLQRQVEQLLQARFPEKYSTRYRYVTFSRIPYKMAYDLGSIQDQLLSELCRDLKNPDDVDMEKASALIDERLSPLLEKGEVWTSN